MKQKYLKRTIRIKKIFKKKLNWLFWVVLLLMLLILIKVSYINITNGMQYEKYVLQQHTYTGTVIPFKRGNIVDTNGNILATNKVSYNIILDCKVLNKEQEDIEHTIEAVVQSFADVDEEKIRFALEEKPESQYYVLKKREEAEKVEKFNSMYEKDTNISGIWFEKEYVRYYPYDELACKVIGFTTSGNVGIGGLEDSYNEVLNGINGREYKYWDNENSFLGETIEAQNGYELVTTINLQVQQIVEKKIKEFEEQLKKEFKEGLGSKNIGVVILNVKNGEIVAMADSNSYDLNNPRELTNYYTDEEISLMQEEEKIENLNAIWNNFCITETYEPGSTAKTLTVAAALSCGILNNEEKYLCTGTKIVDGYPIGCADDIIHGEITVKEAIEKSCNCVLSEIALQLGAEKFCEYQEIFNLGQKTEIDIPGEAQTNNLVHYADNMLDISLATNSFGQNFEVTMIQMASAFASVINDGYYYTPHFVKKILDEEGNVIQNVNPVLQKQTISSGNSALIRAYLYNAVTDGTGRYAKVSGYSLGGKTGTAETQPRGNGKYVISFIGFSPVENPAFVIYVVVEEPNLEYQAQSRYACILARGILSEIYPILNIYPDEKE